MRNRIITVFIIALLFSTSNVFGADKIFLKSGEVIEGKIVYESQIFVRIETIENDMEEYLLSLIDHLEFDHPPESVETQDLKDPEDSDGPENALDTITLKSGRTITGTIIHQTPVFVRIQTNDAVDVQNFIMEEIERIDLQSIDAQEDLSQVVMSDAKASEATDVSEDEAREDDTKVETNVSTSSETDPAQEEIAPYRKVISRDSPEPVKHLDYGDYRRTGYSRTTTRRAPTRSVAPSMTDFEEVQREIAKLESVAVANRKAQVDIMKAVTETPHIYNTDAYNDFLDQTITSSPTQKGEARRQAKLMQKAMEVRAKAASGMTGNAPLDKLKELVPKVLFAIALGVGAPILIGIILLVLSVLKSATGEDINKEVNDELESLQKLKAENKISDEENANMTKDAQSRLKESALKSFLCMVPKIFIYPVRGKVLWATLGATVAFYVFRVAMYAPFYGFFAMIFAFCYIVACIVKIIETAVTQEREDIFDWPSFTEMVDWFGKAFLFIIGWLICHGTALVIFFNLIRFESIRFFVVSLSVSLLMIGMFFYPMYILSMSLVGGAASLNVINIIKAIKTTYISYILLLAILCVSQILSSLTHLIPVIAIPLIGGLFKWFIFVYFFLVNMRLLGMFYKTHRLKLLWFGEDE